MSELEIGANLIGRKVCNPARPEWGVGTVLRVQSSTADGQPRHRVSVQFAIGHRVMLVPPARLTEPTSPTQRTAGWLDTLAGNTLDESLWRLPQSITGVLATPAERVAALSELYRYGDDPKSLTEWARRQTQVADPLSHWSRDELAGAFAKFCQERDGELRGAAAKLAQAEGTAALERVLAALPDQLADAMRAALRRPI